MKLLSKKDIRLDRISFQGAYIFTAWITAPVVGEYLSTLTVFADNKSEAFVRAIDHFNTLIKGNYK